jgi:thioredoxin-like negative regulator of GroEL
MSKKRNARKATNKPFDWKKSAKWTIPAALVLIAAVYMFVLGDEKSRVEHDLSVLGQGKPTMVQIHDPNCQLCRRLKSVVDTVRPDYEENIHFRTANIKSAKGAEFAKKYNVPHVTLLFFNKRGRHVNTLRGVSTSDQVSAALARLR